MQAKHSTTEGRHDGIGIPSCNPAFRSSQQKQTKQKTEPMKIINKSLKSRDLIAAGSRVAAGLVVLGLIILTAASSLEKAQAVESGADANVEKIKVAEGQLLYEIIGQVINSTPTTSTQFGYYTYIK